MKRTALPAMLLAVLALAGCGDLLDTTYATERPGSVDSASVLIARLAERTRLRRVSLLTPRLDDGCALIVHLATQPGLPSPEACSWLRDWLEADDGRQVLLILRGDSPASPLCRRWAEEARSEAERVGGTTGEALRALAGRFDRAAQAANPPAWPSADGDGGLACALFRLRWRPGQAVEAFAVGRGRPEPSPFTLRAGPRIEADGAVPLVATRADAGGSEPWAVAIPVGSSRLIVAANASPLLDGALPDPRARALLASLLDEVAAWPRRREPPPAAWVGALRVREGEPEEANPMAMVFARWPLALAAWHLLALVALWLLARAWWLGRRTTPRDGRHASFGAHVDALGEQLAGERHHQAAARAIARACGLPIPPRLRDADEARAWLAARAAEKPEDTR